MMKRAMKMNPVDTVAVCIQDINAGDEISVPQNRTSDDESHGSSSSLANSARLSDAFTLTANQDITMPHKIALKDIQPGEAIHKYAQVIGYATKEIKKGDWVHIHNVSPTAGS